MNQTVTRNPPVPVFLMFSQMTLRLFQGLIDRCLAARLRGWERRTFAGISTPRPCHITTTLLSELFRSYTSSAPSQVMFLKRTGSECNQSIAKKNCWYQFPHCVKNFTHVISLTMSRCRDVDLSRIQQIHPSTLFTGKMSKDLIFQTLNLGSLFDSQDLCATGFIGSKRQWLMLEGFLVEAALGCNDANIASVVTWLVLGLLDLGILW